MILSSDQLSNEFKFNQVPKRIVSVVPSQTEYLVSLGLTESIVGITKFCIHPEEVFKSKTKIGGTKNLNIEKILSLNPDIVIANKEENDKMQIEELQKHVPVWISDIYNLEDAYEMMLRLGDLFQKQSIAQELVTAIRQSFDQLKPLDSGESKRLAYFIWKDPYMLAGGNTFIDYLINLLGFHNISKDLVIGDRYPEISIAELKQLKPAYIYLSSEPYPFSKKHVDEFQEICPDASIKLVNGEYFSWYGSRLLHSSRYFYSLLNS